MKKEKLLYSGKAKSVYTCAQSEQLILDFRDDTSAFDGKKTSVLEGKGAVNNQFNAYIMSYLQDKGIDTHFIKLLSPQQSLVKKLNMIPLESVVRNISTGSLCRRLGVADGLTLSPPTYELFLKNDELGDPMINETHAVAFQWANSQQMARMQEITYAVNDILISLFDGCGIILVDYKLEFGVDADNNIVMGDEITPDGCRFWDKETRQKLDKDRFRQDLGDVVNAYEMVGRRLGITFDYGK